MPPPQDNARFIFLVILILWLNAGNDASNGLLAPPSLLTARLQRQRAAYTSMARSRWGDFDPGDQRYLNLTGFRAEDGLAWDDLDVFRQRCIEWSRNAYPSVRGNSLWDAGRTRMTWQNATGSVHGPWVRQPGSVYRDAASYNFTALAAIGWQGVPSGDDDGGAYEDEDGDGPRRVSNGSPGYGSKHGRIGGADDRSSNTTAATSSDDEHTKHKEDRPVLSGPIVEWGRNVTGPVGKMLVRLVDQEDEEWYTLEGDGEGKGESRDESVDNDAAAVVGNGGGGLVRAASATVTIEDVDGTGSAYDMRLHGVHWPRQGVLLLATTSDKFSGIFALPHLAPDAPFFESSQLLLNRSLDAALRKREETPVFGSADPTLLAPLWTSSVEGAAEGFTPVPRCEYIMYIQIHPLDASQFLPPASAAKSNSNNDDDYDYDQEQMTQVVLGIERELRVPTGAPIFGRRGVPELKMSAVLYSPDCAYFVETQGPPRFAAVDGQHLRGMKAEVFVSEARLWLLAFAVVLAAQVRLLLAQVRESYTPSTLGRISFYTMAAMLLADGIVFASALAWTLTASASFLPSLVVTLAALLSMIVGGSFLSEVYAVQEPERRRRERQQQQRRQQQLQELQQQQQQQQQQNPPATVTPAAARVEPVPIIVPSDQDIDAEIAENAQAAATPLLPPPATAAEGGAPAPAAGAGAGMGAPSPMVPFSSVAGRMVLLGMLLVFLSLAASTWWAAVRAAYANGLAFAYVSLWVPQIARNTARNSGRAFSWRFTIGQTVLRLLPVAYFYLRADNVLFAQPDAGAFLWLVGWAWVQLWVLAFQDVLGPRFGLPRGWLPEAWEYHPVLREDNVESVGMPIGLVSTAAWPEDDDNGGEEEEEGNEGGNRAASKRRLSDHHNNHQPSSSHHPVPGGSSGGSGTQNAGMASTTNIWTMDCPICCETLDVPVLRAGVDDPTAGGVAGVLARRQYMVTPCRHIFHSTCLEGWLRFRLQCPICREELPPL